MIAAINYVRKTTNKARIPHNTQSIGTTYNTRSTGSVVLINGNINFVEGPLSYIKALHTAHNINNTHNTCNIKNIFIAAVDYI